MNKRTTFLAILIFFTYQIQAKRLLILIIASDNIPVYLELQKLWQSYMNSSPEKIDAYFIKADPELSAQSVLDSSTNTLWLKTEESLRPGIINKTILALEHFFKDNQHAYDYVLRTNLSSFYIYHRLLSYINSLPQSAYAGSLCCDGQDGLFYKTIFNDKTPPMANGCGFICSADNIMRMLEKKQFFVNNSLMPDDYLVGYFFYALHVPFINHLRVNFYSLGSFHALRSMLPDNIFHFRIKNFSSAARDQNDIYIYKELIKQYYPDIFNENSP